MRVYIKKLDNGFVVDYPKSQGYGDHNRVFLTWEEVTKFLSNYSWKEKD
jgi:hypothetical protein